MLRNRFAVTVCVVVVVCAPVRAEEPRPILDTFPFRMKDAKWEDVFAAYSKITGLQGVAISTPPGTFTFVPTDPEQQLTVAQITDVINDALRAKKRILIRRHMTFAVVSTEEKIDWTILPRIEISELSERGSTELVQVIFSVEGMVADDAVDVVKQLPGLNGQIIPHKTMLIVSDSVFNIVRIKRLLNQLSDPKPDEN